MIPTDLSNNKSVDVSIPIKPISRQQFSKLSFELQKSKYPVRAISEVEELSTKIQSFHDKQVREQLKKLLAQYNSYRQVRGDGNCFFRALAFQYFSNIKHTVTEECFPELDSISLTVCKPESIPKQFRSYYDDRFLKHVLKEHWKKELTYILGQYQGNYNRALARLLGDNPYIDFIVILYFRAVCLTAFNKYQAIVKEYLQGDEENIIQTYGEESEGVILDLCNRFLQVDIEVYQVRKEEVKLYQYRSSKRPLTTVQLLFFENHYDLIEKNRESQIRAEKSEMRKRKSQDYFTEVSDKMVEGSCIECNTQGPVYQQNSLCISCYQMSMSSLKNYSKDRFVNARCTQCKYTRSDVSQQFGLCKQCIKYQNRYVEQEKERTSTKSKVRYCCNLCNTELKETQKCPHCINSHLTTDSQQQEQQSKYIQGKCVLCGYKEKLSSEFGCCFFCIRAQQRHANSIIQSMANKKKRCEDCKQDIDPKKAHQCRLMKCNGCDKRSHVLNQKSLCQTCADKQKNKVKHQRGYDQSTCKNCKKIVLTEPLVEGRCQSCFKKTLSPPQGIKTKPLDPQEKYRCQQCGQISSRQIIDGSCKVCRKNTISKTVKKPEIKISTICKGCNRSLKTLVFTQGYCQVCGPRMGV